MTLRREVVYDNRGRMVRVIDHDAGRRPAPRRNEMSKRTDFTPDQKRRLAKLETELREVKQKTRRGLARPIVEAAVAEGRIGADETSRWLERAVELGVDTVRDLIRERRPDRRLAAANAAEPVTAEQDRALAEVFPGYQPRSA